MNQRFPNTPRSLAVAASVFALPFNATASTGVTVESLLLTLLAVGSAFWIAFATITPFRGAMLRIPRNANRLGLFVFGMAALAYAGISILLGKTTLGAGVVVQSIEPLHFWQLVKFQLGAGCVLLVLSLLSGGRSK